MFSIVQNISSVLRPASNDHTFEKDDDHTDKRDVRARVHDDTDGDEDASAGSFLAVQALILFLEDYLETRLVSKSLQSSSLSEDTYNEEGLSMSWRGPEALNSNDKVAGARDAAKAYAHMARVSSGKVSARQSGRGHKKSNLKEIYSLIRMLRQLRDQGVLYLRVDHGVSFLEGIKRALSEQSADDYS